jgi:hypothetical protein
VAALLVLGLMGPVAAEEIDDEGDRPPPPAVVRHSDGVARPGPSIPDGIMFH